MEPDLEERWIKAEKLKNSFLLQFEKSDWNQRCLTSIAKEKAEVEKRYGIKIGQTEIYCARCGRSWGLGKCSCSKEELIPKMIGLNVDREKWLEIVRELQGEYNIAEGDKKDGASARRIAILMGEAYLTRYGELRTDKGIFANNPLSNVMIIEKEIFDVAMEYRLTCDPLERESRIKDPNHRKAVLHVWGVDKTSGMESYTTQLKEWTAIALLTKSEKEVIENGESGITRNDYRGRIDEDLELEEIRASIFEGRERDALRQVEQ